MADSATTGVKSGIGQHQLEYFQRIDEMKLPVPGLIGFGISNHETFQTACLHARGAIIGSAFIRAIGEKKGSLDSRIKDFIQSVRHG